jgi:hypothetical protein
MSIDHVSLGVAKGTTRESFRKLAFKEYNSRGWLNPSQYPNGIVTDEFDLRSEDVVIRTDNNDILAGMRIVRDTEHGFPHEQELGLRNITSPHGMCEDTFKLITETPRGMMAEITKVVGKRVRRMLTLDIVKGLYWYALRNHISLYVIVIDMEFFQLCDKLGVPIEPIGIPVYCEGSWTIPAITVPSKYPHSIAHKNPNGWSYIATPDNLEESLVMH